MPYLSVITVFLILDMHVRDEKYGYFDHISRLTSKCATQFFLTYAGLWTLKIKNIYLFVIKA